MLLVLDCSVLYILEAREQGKKYPGSRDDAIEANKYVRKFDTAYHEMRKNKKADEEAVRKAGEKWYKQLDEELDKPAASKKCVASKFVVAVAMRAAAKASTKFSK